MDLHGRIMNLRCDIPEAATEWPNYGVGYKSGHKDARHAAAELALASDAAMEEAANIIEELCAAYGHPAPLATLARLRFGVAAKEKTP
jgi:hypothetical protein